MKYAVERLEKQGQGGFEVWDRVTFPSGHRMIYVEVPNFPDTRNHHTYWRAHDDWKRGKQLAGASSMTSTFDLRPDRLNKWIATEAASKGDDDPGKEKRMLGTRVHEVFEGLARDGTVPTDIRESDKGYVEGLVKWWTEREPEVIAAEQFVFHPDLGYAGRYDLRCVIDGEVWLVDLKTSKGLYPKYGAQLVAYDYAAERVGLGAANVLRILKVTPEGKFIEVPPFISRVEFLNAMEVRKVAGRVERQQREALAA